MNSGKLFIVATPIGNLEDLTFRALRTLKEVDYILAEDTRVTKKLLDSYEIQKPLISYHHHSDAKKIKEIKSLLEDGKNLALVTDAGTPGISDPGNYLIGVIARSEKRTTKQSLGNLNQAAKQIGSENEGIASPHSSSRNDTVSIIPIPGASALTAALSVAGFPTDKFIFLGFPPHKTKRQKFFKEVADSTHTAVFFESGHRIIKCLQELKILLDEKRQIVVCRELTKKFETVYRGTVSEVARVMKDERGEFVVVINNK
jgi:16S rRNA (cytidine1402-2'-O)-methyltransferase